VDPLKNKFVGVLVQTKANEEEFLF